MCVLTIKTLKYCCINYGDIFFQFEMIINVLVMPPHMLWVYGYYHYFNSFSAETVFRLCLENGPLYKNGLRTEKVKLWHRI